MPHPVYHDALTKASEERLAALVRDLPHPVGIAGGHAVRLRAGPAWQARFGQGYFGSRDIDIVYFVDPGWTEAQFTASAAGLAPRRLRDLKFKPEGMNRFAIYVDDDGRELAAPLPPPAQQGVDYHALYVDPMVTRIHKASKAVLGYIPLDEPLFERVFVEAGLRDVVPALGPDVYLPSAPMLVASKLTSLPKRASGGDKAKKDLCDLYALTAFGGARGKEIRRFVHDALPDARELADAASRHELLGEAADHLDLDVRDLRAVLAGLSLP